MMNFELGSGQLFVGDTPIGSAIPMVSCEPEFSTNEKICFNSSMEFTSELSFVNWDLLNQCCMPDNNHTLKIEGDIPIMIQVRWHKKPRINKKWLKRYGMKPDVIKVEMNAKELEYIPGEIVAPDPCGGTTGITATFNHFDFKTEEIKYIFRNDQLIRSRKIEFV